MAWFSRRMPWTDLPPADMRPMSSSSSFVLMGRMMSARTVSFSSQRCCTTRVSILGLRKAFTVRNPSFQQVVRQGLSIQIMWISVPPSSLGIGY